MSQIQIKLPAIIAFGVHTKRFCRCEYRDGKLSAFCVFGPLKFGMDAKNFVAANISAIILPRSVCSDP